MPSLATCSRPRPARQDNTPVQYRKEVIIIKVTNDWKVEAVQPVTYRGNDIGQPSPRPYFVEFVHERLGHRIQMPLDATTRQTVSAHRALLVMFEDGLLDDLRRRPPLGSEESTRFGA